MAVVQSLQSARAERRTWAGWAVRSAAVAAFACGVVHMAYFVAAPGVVSVLMFALTWGAPTWPAGAGWADPPMHAAVWIAAAQLVFVVASFCLSKVGKRIIG